jgi:hypothetical protein
VLLTPIKTIMDMERTEPQPDTKAEKLVGHVKDYLHTTAELIKLKAVDKMATGLSSIAVSLALLVLIAWVVVLISIGAAIWISEGMSDRYSGFFIVAGFYLVVSFIIYLVKDTFIRKSVTHKVIDHFTDEENITP